MSCFNTPVWIKNVGISNEVSIYDVYNTLPFTSLFATILHSSQCPLNNIDTSHSLLNFAKSQTCSIHQNTMSLLGNFYCTALSSASSDTIDTGVFKENDLNNTVAQSTHFDKEYIFHYYNVHKTVMVKYKGRYRIVYFVLNSKSAMFTLICLHYVRKYRKNFILKIFSD